MKELFDKFKIWIILAFVGIFVAWMLFGTIVWTVIKWGIGIFIVLWLFGTFMPAKLKKWRE